MNPIDTISNAKRLLTILSRILIIAILTFTLSGLYIFTQHQNYRLGTFLMAVALILLIIATVVAKLKYIALTIEQTIAYIKRKF